MSKQNLKNIKRVEFIFVMVLGTPLNMFVSAQHAQYRIVDHEKLSFKPKVYGQTLEQS